MRILLTLILSCLVLAGISAESSDDVKEQINKIKKSSQYIYAESTASTEADARSYAEERLYDEINKWVATQKKMKGSTSLVVSNRRELWNTLSMPRGNNMFRYFVYVRKSDIIPTDNAVVISNDNVPAVNEKIQLVIPEAVSVVASYTDYYEMAEKVKQLKAEGKIKDYARYASLDNPDKCYLVIYNKQAEVVAVLTPGPDRLNVKTNKRDGIANYQGCGAIGIEVE